MSRPPVILRDRARRDVDEAVEHYLAEAGEAVALAFIGALEDACRRIGERPGSGSPRYAHELDIPGLRFRKVKRFPYLIFYRERRASPGSEPMVRDAGRLCRRARPKRREQRVRNRRSPRTATSTW